jgi:hypothetical protein
MRDPKRIDYIIEAIRVIWKANPDYRFYQVVNAIYRKFPEGKDWFFIEDNDLKDRIDEIVSQESFE